MSSGSYPPDQMSFRSQSRSPFRAIQANHRAVLRRPFARRQIGEDPRARRIKLKSLRHPWQVKRPFTGQRLAVENRRSRHAPFRRSSPRSCRRGRPWHIISIITDRRPISRPQTCGCRTDATGRRRQSRHKTRSANDADSLRAAKSGNRPGSLFRCRGRSLPGSRSRAQAMNSLAGRGIVVACDSIRPAIPVRSAAPAYPLEREGTTRAPERRLSAPTSVEPGSRLRTGTEQCRQGDQQ